MHNFLCGDDERPDDFRKRLGDVTAGLRSEVFGEDRKRRVVLTLEYEPFSLSAEYEELVVGRLRKFFADERYKLEHPWAN